MTNSSIIKCEDSRTELNVSIAYRKNGSINEYFVYLVDFPTYETIECSSIEEAKSIFNQITDWFTYAPSLEKEGILARFRILKNSKKKGDKVNV